MTTVNERGYHGYQYWPHTWNILLLVQPAQGHGQPQPTNWSCWYDANMENLDQNMQRLCIKFKQCSKKSDSICFSGSQVLAVNYGLVSEAKAGYIWLTWTENVGISSRSSIDRVVDGSIILKVIYVLIVSELQFWDFFPSALCDRGDDWCWQSLSNQKLVSGRGWGVSSSSRKQGPLLSPDLPAATHTAVSLNPIRNQLTKLEY